MKTTEVEGKIKGTVDPLQRRRIPDKQLRPKARLPDFLPGKLDGTRSEVHAGNPPACAGQGDHVRTGAASDVDGATVWVVLDEFK